MGALYLLQNYQTQLLQFKEIPKGDEYLTPYRKDSFKYLIPFSDSIFFYSENASDFVLQLSNFIHASFSFTSHAFSNPGDLNHPENVTEKSISIEEGNPVIKNHPAKWYPLLFRGGIGFGDAKVYDLNGIQDGKSAKTPFVFGNAVIEAVRFEQSGLKGPRILCGKDFYGELNTRARKIVHPAFDQPNIYEVNWTAVHYTMTDDLNDWFVEQLLMNDFYLHLLVPASNLWKAYNHLSVSQHYYNFLRLIVKGAQHYFAGTEYADKANDLIKEYLAKENLDNKMLHLLS
jgi:hypothetical protein